jgi:DNA-binding protein HU-beta
MSAADRQQVQEALHRSDYYKGPVDGVFGTLTRAGIRRFQQDIGSDATGSLTADQARTGRNPATGEALHIAASKKIAFRPAKELKQAV